MLFRSTGLGKTILTGKVADLKRQGDYLVMHVDTTEPVQWRIRAAINFKDVAKLLGCCIKVSVISFVLSPAQWFNGKPNHPGEF